MRLPLALVLVASAASTNGPKPPAPGPKPPAPLAPAHLTWDMDVERATASLTAAKLAPSYGERRGYFDDLSVGVTHTTEPELHWTIPHGRAEARFQWSDTADVRPELGVVCWA
jgi:hypothetical protein